MTDGYLEKLTYQIHHFSGAELKIKNGSQHLIELGAAERSVPLRRNYYVAIDDKPQSGKFRIILARKRLAHDAVLLDKAGCFQFIDACPLKLESARLGTSKT